MNEYIIEAKGKKKGLCNCKYNCQRVRKTNDFTKDKKQNVKGKERICRFRVGV